MENLNMWLWLVKNKTFVIGGLVAFAFLSLLGLMAYKEIGYKQTILSLQGSLLEIKEAQSESNRKQQEYIDKVYSELNIIKDEVNISLKEQKDEIDKWSNDFTLALADSVQQSTERAIRDSRTEATESARTALRDSADILATKFSNEVSRNLVEIIADAERTRVALKQCIDWSDSVRAEIESKSSTTQNRKR